MQRRKPQVGDRVVIDRTCRGYDDKGYEYTYYNGREGVVLRAKYGKSRIRFGWVNGESKVEWFPNYAITVKERIAPGRVRS